MSYPSYLSHPSHVPPRSLDADGDWRGVLDEAHVDDARAAGVLADFPVLDFHSLEGFVQFHGFVPFAWLSFSVFRSGALLRGTRRIRIAPYISVCTRLTAEKREEGVSLPVIDNFRAFPAT